MRRESRDEDRKVNERYAGWYRQEEVAKTFEVENMDKATEGLDAYMKQVAKTNRST